MSSADRKHAKTSRAHRRRAHAAARKEWKPASDATWFLAIFGCALLIRLVYLFQIDSIPLFYHLAGDGRTYDEWAQRIAGGDWLGRGVFYQAPLYPYFLGALQALIGHNLWLIRLVQIVLGALACALIFVTTTRWFSRPAGIAAGLIVAFYAPALFFDALIEKSILDLFLLCALLFVITRPMERRYPFDRLLVGGLLGLLGLSRENALILLPVIPLWMVMHFRSEPISTRLSWCGLFVAGVLLILVPVGLRNLAAGGEFKLTTSQFGPNFFIGNNSTADGTYGSIRKVIGEPQLEGNDAARLAEKAQGRRLSAGEVSDYWFDRTWNDICSRPADWLRLLGKKWLLVWNAREIEDSDDFYIYQQWSSLLRWLARFGHFGLLAPLAIAGIWLTRDQWRRLWVFYAMIFALSASVAFFFVFGRYRFPLVPLLAPFAGAAVLRFAELYKERSWKSLAFAAALFLFAAAVTNWPLLNVRGPGAAGYNNLANAYDKQGKIDEAVATAQKALDLEPDYGVAHFNLGNLYAAQRRFEPAQQHFERAVRLYPNYAEARSNLGQLLAERGDIDAGIQQFRKAIDLNPSLSRVHLNLGVALAKQGRLEEAVESLRQATLLQTSAEAHYALASVYAAQGHYDDSVNHLTAALRIQWDFAPAHQGLAEILILQGKKAEAMRHYEEARRLLGDDPRPPHSR